MVKPTNKKLTRHVCQACGAESSKWAGQCSECGAWNTLVETVADHAGPGRRAAIAGATRIERLHEVDTEDAPRVASGLAEMDRVLGGGIVPGAVILIGGDPGIGKSTLLLQVLASLEGRLDTLYVSGEESLSQVRLRASRLGLPRLDLPVLSETGVERILDQLAQHKPGLVVIDSIQTLYTDSLDSAPGSVSQLRECAAQLVRHAKASGTSVILVGHVTKEGAIAGPRVLEHMVDTVLYFEHDVGSRYRIVRAVKNRFGAVNELGVFAMTDAGLKEVSNPSALFLSRHEQPVPGSVITVTRQGSRPLLVEVQALVDASHGGSPRRLTLGFEGNRLNMLLAVLHRHGGVALSLALKSLLNERLSQYGEVLECQVDTKLNRVGLKVLLRGEREAITGALERYEIEQAGDERYIRLKAFSCSREWLQTLLTARFVDRQFKLPAAVSGLL